MPRTTASKRQNPLDNRRFLRLMPVDQSLLPGEMVQAMYSYAWPGNVRELQNVLQRFLATQNLPAILRLLGKSGISRTVSEVSELAPNIPLAEAVSALEKQMIRETLAQTNNKKSETARRLHITRRTLRLKIQKYQLDAPQ